MFALVSLALVLNPTLPAPRAVEPVAVFRLKCVAAETFAERLKPLLPLGTRVAVDRTNNTVFVFAMEEDLRDVRAFFARTDVRSVNSVVWLRSANPRYVAGALNALLWLNEQCGSDNHSFVNNVGEGANRVVFVSATPERARTLAAVAEFFDSLASQK